MECLKRLFCIPLNLEIKKKESLEVKKKCMDNRNSLFNKYRNKLQLINDNELNTKKNTFKLKDQFQCLFCGGKTCKHEDYKNHPNPAITGLHSDLIDDNIYASQRISTILIKKFNLIEVFKSNKISLIINLQREGEHPFCGPNEGLEPSGYTYNPDKFTYEGIDVLKAGWKDMDVPDSVSFVMKIVQEIYDKTVNRNEKVLVHCHAGFGRTGIIIACYLIYKYDNVDVKSAVKKVREARNKQIEKKEQYEFCEMFKNCKY